MNIPLTPLRFKRRAVHLYGKKTGVVCAGSRFTYEDFGERCDRLASSLQMLKVPRGSRVAFLAFNCHRLLEAYYGVIQMGAVLLPLNIRLSKEELTFILNDSESQVLFYDSEFHGLVAAMLNGLKTVKHFIPLDAAVDDSWSFPKTYEMLLAEADCKQPCASEPEEDDVAEIFYTSGTTAEPKGVMLTHRNLYLHALSSIIALGIRDMGTQLHAIPLFHVNGWGAPQSLTCMGGTHIMMRRYDPAQVLKLIQDERITYLPLVPTMAHTLLNYPGISGYDYSSLRMILIGGAAPPAEMIRQLESVFGCPCYTGYGLTETSPILTIATPKGIQKEQSPAERTRRQSMTGWPLVGVEIGIVDDQGKEVGHDGQHIGEVVARSDGVMKGYWKKPQETSDALQDGWLFTGDMATLDQEGYLQIVDRKKDVIVSGGENISSIEIERRLYAHDAVLECAVIAVPDPKWGEVPRAFVVLKSGCKATEQELLDFCREGMSAYKCPKSIEFLDSLPKGGTGKILKRELRNLLRK